MLIRLIFGSLISAVLVFVWGFVFWTLLPFPKQILTTLPGQETFIEELKAAVPESGAYMIPGGMESASDEDVLRRHAEGPIATVLYHKAGAPPMAPKIFIQGFLHMFVAAFIAGIIIAASESNTYFSRVMLIFWVGVFCAVWVEINNVVWWYFPRDYALMRMAYHLSSCLIMGIVLAAVVRPARLPEAV
ncbi:MAG: DUF1761 family protein [Planctomycetota bacterium]